MMLDFAVTYLPMYVTYVKILAHVCDHVWQFYSNCQTLEPPSGFESMTPRLRIQHLDQSSDL